MEEVVAVYTDGGLASNNPSSVGGSWAYVYVNAAGRLVGGSSGFIEPGVYGLKEISNNIAELWAVLEALKRLPPGWSGTIFTDSNVTLLRMRNNKPEWAGTPQELREKARTVKARAGKLTWKLLGGHPTEEELKRGRRRDGMPCHDYNVLCDKECQRVVKEFLSGNKIIDAFYVCLLPAGV